jgi:hypothetical protein
LYIDEKEMLIQCEHFFEGQSQVKKQCKTSPIIGAPRSENRIETGICSAMANRVRLMIEPDYSK